MAVVAPRLPYDRLRTISEDFLRQYHPSGRIPVPIEEIVEFAFKLDIVPMPGLADEFDVDAFITSDLTEIRVDRYIQQCRPNRYRFSLAHELAHLLIHRDVFAKLKFSTIAEWKTTMCSIPAEQYGWIEWQAYCLGGLIVVPTTPLADLFASRAAEADLAGVNFKELDIDSRKIVESNIARFFEVSSDVIRRRLQYDKLWQ